MQQIITDSIEIATKQFKSFGFKDEQILPLVSSGKRDLTNEMNILKELLVQNSDTEAINNSIHALKGLLSTMGNKDIVKRLSSIHNETENIINVSQIQELLGL